MSKKITNTEMEEIFSKADDIIQIKSNLSSLKSDEEKLKYLEKIENVLYKKPNRYDAEINKLHKLIEIEYAKISLKGDAAWDTVLKNYKKIDMEFCIDARDLWYRRAYIDPHEYTLFLEIFTEMIHKDINEVGLFMKMTGIKIDLEIMWRIGDLRRDKLMSEIVKNHPEININDLDGVVMDFSSETILDLYNMYKQKWNNTESIFDWSLDFKQMDQILDSAYDFPELILNIKTRILPNRKYTKEMFEYASKLIFEGKKKYVAFQETLERFKFDPFKEECFGKAYRKYLAEK